MEVRMLECRIINGHPWSIGCGDPNPSKRGEDAALMSDLPVEIQHKVSDWIFGKLWKRNTPNYDHDSYELKHRIENELGIYLTNNQMKDAMLQEGFNPVKENELNWHFYISQNSPAFKPITIR